MLTEEQKAELAEFLGDDYQDQLDAAQTDPEYEAQVAKLKKKGLSDAQAAAFATQILKRKKAAKPNMSDDPAKNPFVLSESPEWKAQQEELARVRAQNEQLLASERDRDADKFVKKLKDMGFTEEAGCTPFLTEVRSTLLSDQGEGVIMLAEAEGETPKPFTASALVKRLIEKLPTDEKTGLLKVALSEQANDPLRQHKKPPLNDPDDKVELSDEEFAKQQDEVFEQMFDTKIVRK